MDRKIVDHILSVIEKEHIFHNLDYDVYYKFINFIYYNKIDFVLENNIIKISVNNNNEISMSSKIIIYSQSSPLTDFLTKYFIYFKNINYVYDMLYFIKISLF